MPRGFAKNILHIVTNKNALSYFVQFLDTRDSLALIKFWLDADSFRIAAAAELSRNNSLPETPLLYEKQTTLWHVPLRHSKPLLSKSISLDAFNATSVRCSYDEDSLRLETSSQCTIGSLEDLAEDVEHHVIGSRCNSSASDRCTPVSNATSEEVPSEDAQHLGRPLTDDEKAAQMMLILKPSETKRNCFQTSLASDAVRIYKKYLTNKSAHSIEIPATHLSAIALALGSTDESATTDSDEIQNIFIDAQSYVLDTLERTQLDEFLQSSFYAKYCVDVLTSERLGIEDILYSDAALFFLMEFLEQDSQRHLLEFWVAAGNFAKLSALDSVCDIGQQQSDALVLYEKYFSLQATCPLGLSDRVRGSVEEGICSTDPGTIGRCFEQAVAIIERYLDQHYFKAFVTSHLFYRYLSELLHKVDEPKMLSQPSAVSSKSRHRKTVSDCSADKLHRNISTHNTLLAMGTIPVKKQQLSVGAPSAVKKCPMSDMHIDGRQLCDPDLLWSRHEVTTNNDSISKGAATTTGLSFGRVDALGRYERDFDIDPNHPNSNSNSSKHTTRPMATTTSKFRRVVRKLVNLPEDRAQEEIAWQVAEMIVRDITSVTLNGQPGSGWLRNDHHQAGLVTDVAAGGEHHIVIL